MKLQWNSGHFSNRVSHVMLSKPNVSVSVGTRAPLCLRRLEWHLLSTGALLSFRRTLLLRMKMLQWVFPPKFPPLFSLHQSLSISAALSPISSVNRAKEHSFLFCNFSLLLPEVALSFLSFSLFLSLYLSLVCAFNYDRDAHCPELYNTPNYGEMERAGERARFLFIHCERDSWGEGAACNIVLPGRVCECHKLLLAAFG